MLSITGKSYAYKFLLISLFIHQALSFGIINGMDKHFRTFEDLQDTNEQNLLKICNFVIRTTDLVKEHESVSSEELRVLLQNFFESKNILDYAGAAVYGQQIDVSQNDFFRNVDKFNKKLGSFFKANSVDEYPNELRKYQAVIFNTSGIDVFLERLAFLRRLINRGLQADKLVALVGSHVHRKDLMDIGYLMDLPHLFEGDFDLTNFSIDSTFAALQKLLEKESWLHVDGMKAAWVLVECDQVMKELKERFSCFSGNDSSLRTEQLMQEFLQGGLVLPLSPESPIAFICNSQGAAKTKEMVNKIFSDYGDSVDVLVAKPIDEVVESKLFKDTPHQRAFVKLYHLYRILQVVN